MSNRIYLIRPQELIKERLPWSRSNLDYKIQKKEFVPPVKIGERAVAFVSTEIDAILEAMVAGKSNNQIKTLVAELVANRQKPHLGSE